MVVDGRKLTSLEDKGRGTTDICEDRVEEVIRGEAEGYEREGEECWKPGTHASARGIWYGMDGWIGGLLVIWGMSMGIW